MKKYLPCDYMKSNITFVGNNLAFCCGNHGEKSGPRFDWSESGEESIRSFIYNRARLFQELNGRSEIDLLRSCLGCPKLVENNEDSVAEAEKINVLNNSFRPTVCQSMCIYCTFAVNKADNNYECAKQAGLASKLSGVLKHLEESGLLSGNFRILAASGEMTIHPERDELLSISAKYPCTWFTNAFVFNKYIAQNLRDNNSSSMTVSLDSGTRKTFKKVKSRDMFDKVVENLFKYNGFGNLQIKYILIPGINDSIFDLSGIISLLKQLGHTKLQVACDTFINPLPYEVLESAALLYKLCKESGINAYSNVFSASENDKIKRLAEDDIDLVEYENNRVRQKFRNMEITCDSFASEYRYHFLQMGLTKNAGHLIGLLRGKTGVIWGAGGLGIIVAEFFHRNGIDVYLTDSNKLKHGTVIAGKQVVPFNDLASEVDVILLSNGAFYDSVRAQVGESYEIVDFWAFSSSQDSLNRSAM